MPEGLMKRLKPDFGISGEGERTFAQLVRHLEMGAHDFRTVENLHRFDGGVLVSNPPTGVFLNLDELPRPDRSLVDKRYYTEFGIDSIQTKRGCPLRCDYCTYPTIEGRVTRQRTPANVVDELFVALEQRPEIEHFFFVDSVFNLPPRHAKAVCREMIRRRFDVPWTCYGTPAVFDGELAELMKEASCAGVEIGADSGCDDILERLVKGFRTDRIMRMHENCSAIGLPDCHSFILGTPSETLDHVNRTLDFCKELDPFAAIMMIWTDDYEALDPGLAARRRSFREAITELLRERRKDFPRWIMPSLGINFDERLFRFLRRRGLSGPLWQHIKLARSDERSRMPGEAHDHRGRSSSPRRGHPERRGA